MRANVFGLVLASLFPLWLWPQPTHAGDPSEDLRAPIAEEDEVTPEQARAIRAALDQLAMRQGKSGAWAGTQEHSVAVTALCGLAFLATGSTPTSGRYADNVLRALRYLKGTQGWDGLFSEGKSDSRPMYGHGFTLLFLAECYGMTEVAATESARREGRELKSRIRAAIHLVEESRSSDGGWYYQPFSKEDEGSVTITQIQGLRAARNAGFFVHREVIDGAVDYVRKSQDSSDGGIRYTARGGRSSVALTAAGLAVLFGAGDYGSENVEKAARYLRQYWRAEEDDSHFYYTHLYLSQSMFQLGGSDWAAYFPAIRTDLLRRQEGAGIWTSNYGTEYATACAVLVLALPYRYLPSTTR